MGPRPLALLTTQGSRCQPFPGVWLEGPSGRKESGFPSQFLCYLKSDLEQSNSGDFLVLSVKQLLMPAPEAAGKAKGANQCTPHSKHPARHL